MGKIGKLGREISFQKTSIEIDGWKTIYIRTTEHVDVAYLTISFGEKPFLPFVVLIIGFNFSN